MREHDLSVGGEQSGHVIFLDHNTTGDGMLTAVQVAALVKEKGQPLSELASIMTKYPQVLINVRVATKTGWEENDIIKAAIVTAEGELGAEGRVLVRASGTEPLIRVMAEGPNLEELQSLCQEIADIIGREQGLAEKVGVWRRQEELATMKPTHHFVPSVRFRKAKSTARNWLY